MKSYSCGPAALVNALRCLGKKVSEKRIIKLSGTTKEFGTDEHGLINCIRSLDVEENILSTKLKHDSWNWLIDSLENGRPAILCVDNWQHWVTAIGTINSKVIIFDPEKTIKNKLENGIHILGYKDLMKRWVNKRENHIYAISVSI